MTDERIARLTKLLELDPTDAFCLYGLAHEYAKRADHELAVEYYQKTLDADPAYIYAYYHKAKLLAEIGQDESARAVLHVGLETATQAGDDHAHSEITELLESLS